MIQVHIKKGREVAISRRHPWIFSGGLQKSYRNITDGSIVEVFDYQGNFLAIGHFHHASIAVRILSFTPTQIDTSFYKDALELAWRKRNLLNLPNDENNAFRLVAGEGDNLSGLIIDYYNGHLVIQCHTLAMLHDIPKIQEACISIFNSWLNTIYLKDVRIKDSNYKAQFLYGDSASTMIKEHDHLFEVNWVKGQKTGFFLDQRLNRKMVQDYSHGKNVLNTFCYTGGFSVYALKGGATKVTSVDISSSAIEQTNKNIAINEDLDYTKNESLATDVLPYLKNIEKDIFDLIILDPPAFAKSRKKSHNAIQAYKRINTMAFDKIKAGGFVFTYSCSQVIDLETFIHTVRSAAIEARRDIQIIHILHQSPDHMVNIYHTEGHYLKGLVLLVH